MRARASALRALPMRRQRLGVERLHEGVDLGLGRLRRRSRGCCAERERGAPDLAALALAEVGEELDEAADEVGLGEHHVDRHDHLEAGHHLVDAGAELLRVLVDLLLVGVGEVGEADRHDDAVERLLRAVALEHVEEGEPLLVVVLGGRVATGGVEEDGLVGEPPVAVARAADALAPTRGVEEREVEPRGLERGGLAGARGADDHVPGQRVERLGALHPAELARLERGEPLGELQLQGGDLGPTIGPRVHRLLLGLTEQLTLEGAGGALGAHPPVDEHHHHEEADGDAGQHLREEGKLQEIPGHPDEGEQECGQETEPHGSARSAHFAGSLLGLLIHRLDGVVRARSEDQLEDEEGDQGEGQAADGEGEDGGVAAGHAATTVLGLAVGTDVLATREGAGEERGAALGHREQAVAVVADGVDALEPEREAQVVDLEHVRAVRLPRELIHLGEEALTGGVLVVIRELERPPHPLLPARPRRAEDLLVDERDQRVLGVGHVGLGDAGLLGLARHVVEQRLDAPGEHLGRGQVTRRRKLTR